MTNLYPGLARGPIDHKSSSVINIIANEVDMEMGGCCKLAAAASAELLPRADKVDTAGQDAYGIIVGGDNDGIFGSGGASLADNTTKASRLVGDGIVVVTQGRCPARIGENCTLGAKLAGDGSGDLQLADASGDDIIATALQAGTAGDIIIVDVQREGAF
tara:strand:- start:163 stop:642 length:480 start_codon:yes stop_codon:yes gene_type:complete